MKKYCFLFSATLLILATILLSGFMLSGTEVSSALYTVTRQDMDNTVTAGGRLQYRSGHAVRLPSAAIIRELNVKNGDTVQEDDLLLSYYQIDDAYLALASQYSGISGIDALLSSAAKTQTVSDLLGEVKKYCEVVSVYADQAGTVNEIAVSEDEFTEKNAVVLKIADHSTLDIPVNISETLISSIRTGQQAEIVFHAVPEKTFSGTVTALSEEASQTSGMTGKETTVEVTLTLNEPDDSLRVGYSANCSIITSTDKDVLILPYDYLLTDEEGNYVYVYRGGRAVLTRVTVGTEYKSGTAIVSGLREGDKIVTNTDHITDGQRISAEKGTEEQDD